MSLNSIDPLEFSRLTIFLDIYDKSLLTQMAENKNQTHSEIIRYIILNWFESYPHLLKEHYRIDINKITRNIELENGPQVIQNSIQKLEKHSLSKKSPELYRITLSLDAFNNKIITLISERKQEFRSEIVRDIVHGWIKKNSDILKSNFDIDRNEVIKEIELNKEIQNTIQKLIDYSDAINKIDLETLAKLMGVNNKVLEDIILVHNDKLEKLGIKLSIKDNLIIKE
ncbi:MAG: hypothetical protein ACW96X_05815 [Promethearchaeota archaeon]|jgi:hypothetical protein